MEYDVHDRYIPGVEMIFVTFGVLGTLVGLALNVVDYRNGSVLNTPAATKAEKSLVADDAREALLSAGD